MNMIEAMQEIGEHVNRTVADYAHAFVMPGGGCIDLHAHITYNPHPDANGAELRQCTIRLSNGRHGLTIINDAVRHPDHDNESLML